jgi:2,3-bisphosphoglycerate-independent phosphoglycerate mutase
MDGLGGLPGENGLTTLEAAKTPSLNKLAKEGICGLSSPVGPGITPGSGPAHLALFGYDPLEWEIGRGVLEALGIGFDLGSDDLAARGNFCTIDLETGNIEDRRAGRIPSEEGKRLVEQLRQIRVPDVDVFVEPVRDYRFVLVLRGRGLEDGLTETDPQQTGVPSLPVKALHKTAERSATLVNYWLNEARKLLAGEYPANSCNVRGIAKIPPIPKMPEIYKLKMAAIASYPMYRGIAKLVGMDVLKTGDTLEEQLKTMQRHWEDYEFFFFHVKKTDSSGEDGNFDAKRSVIEQTDGIVPDIMELKPDVLVVTGDHSTPAILESHSWHELPVLLWSRFVRPDSVETLGERPCMLGGLGHLFHKDLMPIMMANALRLSKLGA